MSKTCFFKTSEYVSDDIRTVAENYSEAVVGRQKYRFCISGDYAQYLFLIPWDIFLSIPTTD